MRMTVASVVAYVLVQVTRVVDGNRDSISHYSGDDLARIFTMDENFPKSRHN